MYPRALISQPRFFFFFSLKPTLNRASVSILYERSLFVFLHVTLSIEDWGLGNIRAIEYSIAAFFNYFYN